MDTSTAESQTTSLDDQKLTSQISEEEVARRMAMVDDTQRKNKDVWKNNFIETYFHRQWILLTKLSKTYKQLWQE